MVYVTFKKKFPGAINWFNPTSGNFLYCHSSMTADPTQDPESNNLTVTAVSYLLKQKSKTNFNRGYF